MKNFFVIFAVAIVACYAFVACGDDSGDKPIIPTLTVSPEMLTEFTADTEEKTLTITSNVTWSASVTPTTETWCALSTASGSGNGSVKITVADNALFTTRTATVTIKTTHGTKDVTKTVTVTQAANLPTLTVSPETLNFVAGGETKTFTEACSGTWSVSSDETWCTYAISDNTVTIDVTANSSSIQRKATITVETTSGSPKQTKTVTITQTAAHQPGGFADRITVSGTGENAKLVITRDETDGGLYFKFGSVVGIYSANGANRVVWWDTLSRRSRPC